MSVLYQQERYVSLILFTIVLVVANIAHAQSFIFIFSDKFSSKSAYVCSIFFRGIFNAQFQNSPNYFLKVLQQA